MYTVVQSMIQHFVTMSMNPEPDRFFRKYRRAEF